MASQLAFVQTGAFSGSATSLRRAMAERVSLEVWDLLRYSRTPAMVPARLRAVVEAKLAGDGVSWTKTRAWSEALQHAAGHAGLGKKSLPIVFVQTLSAFVLDGRARYVVYTDRVAREGAASKTPFASRFSRGWLEREEALLRGAHRIFLMGPSTAEVLEREYGIPSHKIIVVGAGPNMVLGHPVDRRICRTLLFVGIEWERKGGPTLLAAFADARRDFPDLELLLVGGARPDPVPEGVRVRGKVSHQEMEDLYSRADAVILPSVHDAVPITLIEALYKGLPCIGTTAGNQAWLVGDAGLIVEPGRPDALAAAIRELVGHYPAYKSRAMERSPVMREAFRWDLVAERILQDVL